MNEPAQLRVFVDYVDPLSWILEARLKAVFGTSSSRGPDAWEIHPLEVRPPPVPLLDPEDRAWQARWDSAMGEEEAGPLGLRRPWIVPWTRKAHELAFFAREADCFLEIHNALFRAYLSEGRDIGRVDVLVDIARSEGLDPAETKAVLDVDRFRESVESAQDKARELDLRGPPALFIEHGSTAEGLTELDALRTFLGRQETNEL